jgi:SAM-dependent methyltransferase
MKALGDNNFLIQTPPQSGLTLGEHGVIQMRPYFSGEELYGEDLSVAEREQWYRDEQEAYAELVSTYSQAYEYKYHALNVEHGFRHLPQRPFRRVLGVGSAFGHEFEPILERCGEVIILDPSEGLTNPRFTYVRPSISGVMPFEDSAFDLVTCLSALHHVPNVSTHLNEIARVLAPDGFALISDPITSMGDWRTHRRGLTKHERGIPLRLFRSMLNHSGLSIYRESLLNSPFTARLQHILPSHPYNTEWVVKLDSFICSLPIWFNTYHAERWWQKLRATGVFFIVCKSPVRQPSISE